MGRSTELKHALRAWMDIAIHRSMRGWAHHARASGLSMPQFSILMQLQHHGHCGISDISERFEITAAAASQHVENLVQAGLLELTRELQVQVQQMVLPWRIMNYTHGAFWCLAG